MVMTLFTFVLNDVVVPRSQRYAEVTLKRSLGRSLASETGRDICLLYTSPSPRDATLSRMPSSA